MRDVASRLLSSLDARIAADPGSFASDCLRCERACYRARQGRADEALETAALLRERYRAQPSAAISAWANLVEGLCRHYEDLGEAARDKLRRAHALSGFDAAGRLHLLCAAWLAHVDYAHHDAVAMARHVRQALQQSAADEHAVRSRACVVVAQALHLGDGLELATPWYAASRRHALAEGDDLTVSALIYNRGQIQLTRLGEAALEGGGSDAVAQAVQGLASSRSYDRLIGAASLAALEPLLHAQVLCVLGDARAALDLFEAHLGRAEGQPTTRIASTLLADRAWCRMKLGQRDAARADAEAALASLVASTHVDDRAATHTRLKQVYEDLGEADAAQHHAALAARHWGAFRELQTQMVSVLEGLDPALA